MTEQNGTCPARKEYRLIPVTQWKNYHPWPPIGGLRHLIFFEKTNGFAHCVVRVGSRVLIDEKKFFEWAGSQEMKKGA